jgi:hypothetical protein
MEPRAHVTAEPNDGVSAIAKWLFAASAASAKPGRLEPCDDATGAEDDFHVAANSQGPVETWGGLKKPATCKMLRLIAKQGYWSTACRDGKDR